MLRCQHFLTEEQQGFTLTATTAKRDRSFTVTAARQFKGRVQRDTSTRGPDGVAQGDGSPVNIDLLRTHTQFI